MQKLSSKQLKEEMSKRGYTIPTLSRRVGVRYQTIWNWLNGSKIPNWIGVVFSLEDDLAKAKKSR